MRTNNREVSWFPVQLTVAASRSFLQAETPPERTVLITQRAFGSLISVTEASMSKPSDFVQAR